jgi:glycogen debranching enzyme
VAGDSSVDIRADTDTGEHDPHYIRTTSAATDDRALVLKDGDSFIVLDRHGDVRPVKLGQEGLYHDGTRHLSCFLLRFGRYRPLLLSSLVRADNVAITVDLTNPDLTEGGVLVVPRGTLHVSRLMVLSQGSLLDRIRVRNYGLTSVSVSIDLEFDADFIDLFEARGTTRPQRGERRPVHIEGREVVLSYVGLDGVTRTTRVQLEAETVRLSERRAHIECVLPPHGEHNIGVSVRCENGTRRPYIAFPDALQTVAETLGRRRADCCGIVTSNQQFNEWIDRSLADLSMMLTDTRNGEYPYAGVPWFSTPFGRDGLITAFECLWMNPGMARGVLQFLSATQATVDDPVRDAQPGKILHEMRSGEMAALGEVPFGRYYGSHDATALFVMLAAAYLERTDDRAFVERIWPSIEAALQWLEGDGDMDADGFVEYARQSPTGLVQQGWKDSHDSISHADGALADAPIALCEIQAYLYAAWNGAASLSAALGNMNRAGEYIRKAGTLRDRFDKAFWRDWMGTYALALDGRKQACEVRASNAGHTLFTGIALPNRAASVARTLMAPESFSGWGIRTLATSEVRYNPMSYHNGSIWPHDNALIAAGFARYGLHDEALTVLGGLFEASLHMDLHRLPELFCGFQRGRDEAPVSYPVACNPQAWASGSVFLLLQSVLGLEVLAAQRTVKLTRPRLPAFLNEVRITNLRVGPHSLDLLLERHESDVGIDVLHRNGPIEVVAIK